MKQEALKLYKRIINAVDDLNPNQHYMVSSEDAAQLNEKTLRTRVSERNQQCGSNLRVHKDANGALWIWYDPAPRTTSLKYNPLFTEYVEARRAYDVATASGNIAECNRLIGRITELHYAIENTHKERQRKRKGSTYITDEQAIKQLSLTKALWEMIPPRDRLQLKIRAGVEIRNAEIEREKQQKAQAIGNGIAVQAIEIPNQQDSTNQVENKLKMDASVLQLMGITEDGYTVENGE